MEILALIGRVLFAILFIKNGIAHFTQRAGMVGYAKTTGLPMPEVAVPLSGLMLIVGGVSVLVGFYGWIGAWLLIAFLIPAAFTAHKFWGLSDAMQAANQEAHFYKNIALAGAALLIAYFGTGPYSLTP